MKSRHPRCAASGTEPWPPCSRRALRRRPPPSCPSVCPLPFVCPRLPAPAAGPGKPDRAGVAARKGRSGPRGGTSVARAGLSVRAARSGPRGPGQDSRVRPDARGAASLCLYVRPLEGPVFSAIPRVLGLLAGSRCLGRLPRSSCPSI